jgi:hypothetical protein
MLIAMHKKDVGSVCRQPLPRGSHMTYYHAYGVEQFCVSIEIVVVFGGTQNLAQYFQASNLSR